MNTIFKKSLSNGKELEIQIPPAVRELGEVFQAQFVQAQLDKAERALVLETLAKIDLDSFARIFKGGEFKAIGKDSRKAYALEGEIVVKEGENVGDLLLRSEKMVAYAKNVLAVFGPVFDYAKTESQEVEKKLAQVKA